MEIFGFKITDLNKDENLLKNLLKEAESKFGIVFGNFASMMLAYN